MLDRIVKNLQDGRIIWRQHALARMLERGISRDDIKRAILGGEIIETYPESRPCPSYLILGYSGTRPLHAVVALDEPEKTLFVITAYIPHTTHFSEDFKTRKR